MGDDTDLELGLIPFPICGCDCGCEEMLSSDEEAEADLCDDCADHDPDKCSFCGEPTDPGGFVDGTVCYRCRPDDDS
jgi:hypothetical protein